MRLLVRGMYQPYFEFDRKSPNLNEMTPFSALHLSLFPLSAGGTPSGDRERRIPSAL